MYPFPTVCADKQSTDWFHAISRTLKWNERERQKSFVVVEERSPVLQDETPASEKTKSTARSSSDESEEANEVSDEEEAIFDIDDSSSDARATVSAGIQTFEDATLGHEKAVEQLALGRTEKVATFRPRHALRARSRSRVRRQRSHSPASSSEQSGVETPGRYAGPHHFPPFQSHHVNFDIPDESPGLLADGAEGNKQPVKLKEREAEHDNARTPTVMSQAYHKSPRQGHPRSSDHRARAFAVWGHDESDSAASDNSDA
jgi:NAD+ kinase